MAKDKQMLKSALKQRRELQLAITIDVSIPFFKQRVSFLIFHYYFTRNLGNLAALKAKSREIGYGGDGDMVVGAVIAPEVIVTAQVRCLVERVLGLDGSSMQLCVCY